MKSFRHEELDPQEIPSIDIIDLDQENTTPDATVSSHSSNSVQEQTYKKRTSASKNDSSKTSEEPEEHSFFEKYILKMNWHIILLLVVVVSVILIVHRVSNWGIYVKPEYNPDEYDESYEVEVQDNILPNLYEDPSIVDDGIRTVVAFGNSPFADDRDTKNSLATLIEELSDAVVYDCSVAGSYVTAEEPNFNSSLAPMDAFSFYWLATIACVDATNNIEDAIRVMGDSLPSGALEAYEILTTLDFRTVDVITLMYDSSDYMDGRPMGTLENPSDIQTYYGNLNAGIELIQNTFPHIRIIVMSPTYAYAIDEKGEYVSSDLYRYADESLSSYAMIMERCATMYTASFLDNFYGTVNELNADEYLEDHVHLNLEGRKKVAERFVYALEYYD